MHSGGDDATTTTTTRNVQKQPPASSVDDVLDNERLSRGATSRAPTITNSIHGVITTPAATSTTNVHPKDFNRYWSTIATRNPTPTKHRRSTSNCLSVGMQTKCYFQNLIVEGNTFYVTGTEKELRTVFFPSPIYPADGQVGPLLKYHKYSGHTIRRVVVPEGGGSSGSGSSQCTHVVSRPTVFLFRMSGHSTYHLWENNLGPFFSTLQQKFGGQARVQGSSVNNSGSSSLDGGTLNAALNDPKQLLVAFVDQKPTSGPKAPKLLDRLLHTFTNRPLLNASKIQHRTCFEHAVVGIADNSFPHKALLYRMMDNVAGYSPPSPLPASSPREVLFVSRNHPSVIRGRKIRNEEAAIDALNATMMRLTGGATKVRKVYMEDYVFEEQIKLAMRTHMMFSPHGGGVANCIWMREGAVVVEFVAPVGKTLLSMYHSMCRKSGVSHVSFLADPDPEDEGQNLNGNPRLFSNMVLPIPRLLSQAEQALEVYRANYARQQQKLTSSSKK